MFLKRWQSLPQAWPTAVGRFELLLMAWRHRVPEQTSVHGWPCSCSNGHMARWLSYSRGWLFMMSPAWPAVAIAVGMVLRKPGPGMLAC